MKAGSLALVLLGLISLGGDCRAADVSAMSSRLLNRLRSIQPESTQIMNFPLVCETFTKRDIGNRRFHGFACVGLTIAGTGVVLGGLQSKRGDLVCQLSGYYDGCLTLSGCGTDRTVC
jgi:hypothetical protein